MKVYRVDPFPKPVGSPFDNYAQLSWHESDDELLDVDKFNGQPYPNPWRRVTLHFDNPLCPRADFYEFGLSTFVCTGRARELVGSALKKAGEFLPVNIEGEERTHFIYNVTKSGAFIDDEKSIWEHHEPKQLRMGLVAPAFKPASIRKLSVFKLAGAGADEIYCVERTGRLRDNEFKALVEYHNLTGLRFDFAWSEQQGPVPWQNPPRTRELIWQTGDGKKINPSKFREFLLKFRAEETTRSK